MPHRINLSNSLSFLASIYGKQGRYAEAEPLLERAIELREQARTSPEFFALPHRLCLAESLTSLASLYGREGRFAEAEALLQRALAIQEDALAVSDPQRLPLLEAYAELLRATGRSPEAAAMQARTEAIRRNTPADSSI